MSDKELNQVKTELAEAQERLHDLGHAVAHNAPFLGTATGCGCAHPLNILLNVSKFGDALLSLVHSDVPEYSIERAEELEEQVLEVLAGADKNRLFALYFAMIAEIDRLARRRTTSGNEHRS
jgi:hypothetical protein